MEVFDIDNFNKLLQSSKMGRKFVYTDITGSTMDDARRLAHDVREYPHGTVVMAEQQTKARGARDHKWDATNTGNIYMSVVLHMPPFYKTFEGSFDLEVAACLAVLQVVKKFGITKVIPKWPNDLWVRGHKLAGFLVEDGRFDIPGTLNCLFILGMGINVNADVRRSSELQGIATSMICERGGQHVNREKFLAEVCLSLEEMLSHKKEDNFSFFLKENLFQEQCDLSISNTSSGKVLDGKFLAICKNWDVKFVDTQTGEIMRGSSEMYTVRPKVMRKIVIMFPSIHNTSSASSLSKWLTAVIDTSKYVVCLVPEATITATDDWMKRCSLLVLVENVCEPDLVTKKLSLFLRSGGSVMASGSAAVYLASVLHVHLKQMVFDLSADSKVIQVHLKTETILDGTNSVPSAYGDNIPLSVGDINLTNDTVRNNDTLPDNSTACVAKPQDTINMVTSTSPLPQPQIVIFPADPICYYFCQNGNSVCCEQDNIKDELYLINPHLTQSISADRFSSLETQVKACVINSGDQDELLTVFTGNVLCGGKVALWGFNIMNMSEAAQGINAADEDRFKRDLFLQQVLEVLLKS